MRMHPQKPARSFFTPQVYPHILGKIFRPFSYTHDPQGPPDLFRGSLGWLSESLFCLCETDSYAKRGFVRHLTSIAAPSSFIRCSFLLEFPLPETLFFAFIIRLQL